MSHLHDIWIDISQTSNRHLGYLHARVNREHKGAERVRERESESESESIVLLALV